MFLATSKFGLMKFRQRYSGQILPTTLDYFFHIFSYRLFKDFEQISFHLSEFNSTVSKISLIIFGCLNGLEKQSISNLTQISKQIDSFKQTIEKFQERIILASPNGSHISSLVTYPDMLSPYISLLNSIVLFMDQILLKVHSASLERSAMNLHSSKVLLCPLKKFKPEISMI